MHPRALKRSAARCRFLLRNCLRCAILNLRPGWIFVHAVSDHRTLKPLPSRRLGLLVRDLLSQLRPLAEPPQVPRRNCRSAQPGTLSPPLQPAQGVVVSSSTKANEQAQGLDRDPNIGSRGLWMACYRKRRWLREQDSARKPCVSSASLRRQDRPLSAAVTPNQCPQTLDGIARLIAQATDAKAVFQLAAPILGASFHSQISARLKSALNARFHGIPQALGDALSFASRDEGHTHTRLD
ncbi:hypothetical protein ABIB90_006260 [Bradyrhizobium sp. JR4.1]